MITKFFGMNIRFTIYSLFIGLIIAALAGAAALAKPGDLDFTFGGDGIVTTNLGMGGDDFTSALAIQPDGKIIVGGTADTFNHAGGEVFALARFNSDGYLDPHFGTLGLVTTDMGSHPDKAYAIALQADHKIILAGTDDNDFALARYNPDGSLDSSFDGDGRVITAITGNYDVANGVAVQVDGKIVAVGTGGLFGDCFAVVRYNSDGSLDKNFSGDGIASTLIGNSDNYAYALAIQSDNKILVGGNVNWWDKGDAYAVARYNSDGSLDPTFGVNGVVTTTLTVGADEAYAMLVQADNKIVLAGKVYGSGNGDNFALVRYNSNGTLDTTFDGDGKVTTTLTSWDDRIYTLALQPDQKIVAAGEADGKLGLVRYNSNGSLDATFDGDGKLIDASTWVNWLNVDIALQTNNRILVAAEGDGDRADFKLARYNADGSLDTSFSGDGSVMTPVTRAFDWAYAFALQDDGKIVAVGDTNNNLGDTNDFAMARYNTDGSLDTSFDSDGMRVDEFYGDDSAYAVAIQSDGKIIAAGATDVNGTDDFALLRSNTDGSWDDTFPDYGRLKTDFFSHDDEAWAVALQDDGKIVAAGWAYDGSHVVFAVARYTSNGVLDTTFDGDGKATTAFGAGNAFGQGMLIQPDDKIVVVGYYRNSGKDDFAMARYNSNGSLDPTFNGTGKVVWGFVDSDEYALDVAIQTDHKLVVAGGIDETFALARFDVDGDLDSSFWDDGFTMELFGNVEAEALALAIQPDGKIVGVGDTWNGADHDFAMARYNSDGSLDTTFSDNGLFTYDFGFGNDYAEGLLLQTDGKIILGGGAQISFDDDFALLRLEISNVPKLYIPVVMR